METLIFIQHMVKTLNESEPIIEQLEAEGWKLHEQVIIHKHGVRFAMSRHFKLAD